MMKTTAKESNPAKSARPSKRSDSKPDEEVAVIVEAQSGAEYYMFIIDFFKIEKKSYVVMVPYEPDRVKTKDDEIVIMHSSVAKNGDQLYVSIRDKKELESAFDTFFKRFEESTVK